MYAVIASGGKQYRVTLGQVLTLEKLETPEGKVVTFDQVLMVADGEDIKIGQPLLKGVTVKGTVKSQGRDKKVRIVKFKRRKHSMKHMGHRQSITEVEITQIGDKKAEDKNKAKASAKTAEKETAKKDTAKKKVVKAEETKPSAKKVEAKKAAEKKPAAKKADKPKKTEVKEEK